MLFVQMPLLLVSLPIVILIEGALCRRWFSLEWGRALKVATRANLLSTLVGFPLMWISLVVLQMAFGGGGFPKLEEPWFSVYTVTAQAAWLLPVEGELYWMIPTACLVLLVPAFFVTIFIERRVYRKHFADDEGHVDPTAATWKMHFASYGFLALTGFGLLGSAITKHNREQGVAPQSATRSESGLVVNYNPQPESMPRTR